MVVSMDILVIIVIKYVLQIIVMNVRKIIIIEWIVCYVMKGIIQRIINVCFVEDIVVMESFVIKIQECVIVVVYTDGMESIVIESV